MSDFGHWSSELLTENFDPLNFFGFVYRITRVDTGRSYIGKKQLVFTRRKKVKGRVNRKHVKKESDWKDYTGSCDELNEEILSSHHATHKENCWLLSTCWTRTA